MEAQQVFRCLTISVNSLIVFRLMLVGACADPKNGPTVQMKTHNLVYITLLAATFAATQSALADQCNDKPSTPEIVKCLEKQTASWDAVVEFAYANALRSANAEVSKAVKQTQELWLGYRDASCRAAGLGEGKIAAVESAECRLRMTAARAAELGGDAEPSNSSPAQPGLVSRDEEDLNSGSQRDEPPDGADPMPAHKIREVYALLAADKLDNESNPIANPQLAKSFFAGPFLELWAKDQKCWESGEGAAQMWVGGQDYKISDVRVTVPMGTADYQRVLASVTSFGSEQHWAYEFRRSNGTWLVRDVLLEGRSLSEAIKRGCAK